MGVPHIEWFLLGKIPLTVTYIYIYINMHDDWGYPYGPMTQETPFLCCLKQLNPHLRCVSIHAVLDLHAA